MPIYEFYSPDTHRIYSFFARSLAQRKLIPRCPDDPKACMERVLSQFAVTGNAQEKSSPDGDFSASDPRMERAMAEMEGEMAGMNEEHPDPRQLGRLMRKMTEATGQALPDTMEQMLSRLEQGEDPEKLEEEYGEAMADLEGEFGEPATGDEAAGKVRARAKNPSRDPTLHEMSDFLPGNE